MNPLGDAVRARLYRVAAFIGLSNLTGAVLSWVYLALISPNPPSVTAAMQAQIQRKSILTFVAFMLLSAVLVGPFVNARADRAARWAREGRRPTAAEVEQVLALPRNLLTITQSVWLAAATVFGVQQATFDTGWLLVWRVVTGILLGGLITSALTYLLVERTLRPLAALVLSYRVLDRPRAPGILPRLVVSWLLGSGLPLLAVGLTQTIRTPEERQQLTGAVWFLVAVGLVVGATVMTFAAKSVAEPIRDLREVQREVERGRLDVRVSVSDASEVGLLQTGFNEMVAGLEERGRLQDLFGRHVGEDVARQALERGVALGGEVRDVSVLFADVIGSTTLAERLAADELLTGLNAFFAAVVTSVREEGGWVNKFAGDGALCVFGAPADLPDHRAAALRAAARLRERLAGLPYGLRAAVGVSSGPVTAGNVGAEERFEYTVIGDPVNEAARLTELAKTTPGGVLASGPTVRGAGAAGEEWRRVGTKALRGRSTPTELYAAR